MKLKGAREELENARSKIVKDKQSRHYFLGKSKDSNDKETIKTLIQIEKMLENQENEREDFYLCSKTTR